MVEMRVFMLSLVAALLCIPCSVKGLSVGVAPPVLDMGEMLAGESKSMEFYLMTDYDKNLLVDLSTKKARRDFYVPGKGRFRYDFVSENASEEDISGWLTFLKNSVVVPPEKRLVYLTGGGIANANKRVDIIVGVPGNAEPGYHAAFVSPYPRISFEGGGTGLGIISTVEMGYVVKVPGEAIRDAGIAGIDFSMDRPGYGTLRILVKNRGTVTLSARADSVRVFNSSQVVAELVLNEELIAPGRVGELSAGLDTRGLEGVYEVSAHVEWLTGEDSMEGEIEIAEYVPPPPVTGEVVVPPPAPAGFPLWILPMILVAVAVIVYRWSR
jgi:hypothetical protein